MTDEKFKIYIDRLRNGTVESLNFTFSPDLFELTSADISFTDQVKVRGEVYATDNSLVCHLDLDATVLLPCSICNELTKCPVVIRGLYHVEDFDEIKSGTYDIFPVIRESILLECPQFTECHQGKCPEREKLQKYINQSSQTDDEKYHPFRDFDLDGNNN